MFTSRERKGGTPWTAAHQASLSITNSRSPPKPMSIESMMPSNHLILCHPLLLLPSIFSWGWNWSFNTLTTWCEKLTHWKRPWYWESLRTGREGEDRGWDGWMASLTQWTWVWANSRRQWRTGKPGLPQSCKELGTTERLNNSNNFIMRLNYGRWSQERWQNVKLQSLSLHLDHSCTSRNWPKGGRRPARSQREWWVRS